MSDSLLKRHAGRKVEELLEGGNALEVEAPADLGPFGYLRGIRDRAVMLELKKKDGHVLAIGYGYIERMEFDPMGGIVVWALGQRIRIKGRNLNAEVRPNVRLLEALTRHKVPWIRELDHRKSTMAKDTDTLIDAIEW